MRGMDEPYDYETQQADERRMQEAERDRFLAAHPGYNFCPKHPERPVVDANISTKRFCAECVENHLRNYADLPPQPFSDGGISAWIHGAGERPSSYFTKEPK